MAWAISASLAARRSWSISSALIRLASPYQISLTRENGMSSRCEARKIATLTRSPAGRGSAHRRTSVRASSIEEAYGGFGDLVALIIRWLDHRCLMTVLIGGSDGCGALRWAAASMADRLVGNQSSCRTLILCTFGNLTATFSVVASATTSSIVFLIHWPAPTALSACSCSMRPYRRRSRIAPITFSR